MYLTKCRPDYKHKKIACKIYDRPKPIVDTLKVGDATLLKNRGIDYHKHKISSLKHMIKSNKIKALPHTLELLREYLSTQKQYIRRYYMISNKTFKPRKLRK